MKHHITIQTIGLAVVVLLIFAVVPSYFFRMRTGWVTVAEIYEDLSEGTMCPQAVQQNMYGFPLPMYGSFGNSLCSAPLKQINVPGIVVNAIIVGAAAYAVRASRRRQVTLLLGSVLGAIALTYFYRFFAI